MSRNHESANTAMGSTEASALRLRFSLPFPVVRSGWKKRISLALFEFFIIRSLSSVLASSSSTWEVPGHGNNVVLFTWPGAVMAPHGLPPAWSWNSRVKISHGVHGAQVALSTWSRQLVRAGKNMSCAHLETVHDAAFQDEGCKQHVCDLCGPLSRQAYSMRLF